MPRYRRVSWRITAGSNAKATTIKTTLDTVLAGKALQRTITANARSGTLVTGDYLFTLTAAGDTVYTTARTALNGTDAVSGYCDVHDCDHDAQGRETAGGCSNGQRTEKGTI